MLLRSRPYKARIVLYWVAGAGAEAEARLSFAIDIPLSCRKKFQLVELKFLKAVDPKMSAPIITEAYYFQSLL